MEPRLPAAFSLRNVFWFAVIDIRVFILFLTPLGVLSFDMAEVCYTVLYICFEGVYIYIWWWSIGVCCVSLEFLAYPTAE